MRKFYTGLTILIIFFCSPLHSQQLKPVGKFIKDSIRIGDPVPYSLKFSYPRELQVIFPDSNYNFFPFELSSREYFPTRSDSAISIDSAVYYLSSFEIDPVQTISMSVYVLQNEDSSTIETDVDSIFFSETIPVLPDSVVLKENIEHNRLNVQFNYPLLLIISISFVIVLIILYFIFGKGIRNRLTRYRMKKEFRKFISKYDKSMQRAIEETNPEVLLLTVVIWKNYMERLNGLPYTKMTTKEIGDKDPERKSSEVLKSLDKSIYGAVTDPLLSEDLEHLKVEAEESYREKIEQLEHV